MSEENSLSKRKTAQEEEYFLKKEKELIDQIRRRGVEDDERRQMAKAIGVEDEQILATLQEMGYTRETVVLLHLVPLVQVAWASGSVTPEERRMVQRLSEWRGIEKDSPAWRQLNEWLDARPSDEFLLKTLRLIRHLVDAHPDRKHIASRTDLISFCMRIAAVSGGFLGIGSKVSEGEQEALDQIVSELTARNPEAVQQVLDED